MRSVLAGLRRLVVPWGASGATPRVVLDADDSLLNGLGVNNGQLFYYNSQRAYVLTTTSSIIPGFSAFGQFALHALDGRPGAPFPLVQFIDLDVDYDDLTEGNVLWLGLNSVQFIALQAETRVLVDAPEMHVDGDTEMLGGLWMSQADGTTDNIVLGSSSGNPSGNMITSQSDDLTLYSDATSGPTDGVKIRVNDGSGYRNGLWILNSGAWRTSRDDWFTTGSAANVRLFTGDSGDNARIGISTSAERFKQQIEPARIGARDLVELQPVTFRDRGEVAESGDAAGRHLGLVAEQVDQTALGPYLVDYDPDGRPFSVQYDRLAVALLAVVQDQARQIEQLSARISALENEGNR